MPDTHKSLGDAFAAEYALFADWSDVLTSWHEAGGVREKTDREKLLRELLTRLYRLDKLLGRDNPYRRALIQARNGVSPDPNDEKSPFQKWLGSAIAAVYGREPDPWDRTNVDFNFLRRPEKPYEMGRLGEYGVLRVLGAGGMGVVFEAYEIGAGQKGNRVALKTVRPNLLGEDCLVRLRREARIAKLLTDYPHIVQFKDLHTTDDGRDYFAMQYVFGPTLHDLLDLHAGRPVSAPLAVELIRQIATGLKAAHGFKNEPITHRDLKPANIFLKRETNRNDNECGWHVKIGDFGLATFADATRISASGDIIGTPGFLAPEQIEGRGVELRTDVYALGAIAFQMLTGKKLRSFEGHLWPNRHSALTDACGLPPLADLILQMLEGEPGDRPHTDEVLVRLSYIQPKLGNRANAKHREQLSSIKVYLWEESDQPPESILRDGAVLTGQVAQVKHLKNGCFANRSVVYGEVLDAAVRWIEKVEVERVEGSEELVPIFWISGRSGTGKSVALLHLLARLHREQNCQVLFLRSNPERLPRTLDWCRKNPIGRVVIALDDPYAPTGQQTSTFWANVREEYESIRDLAPDSMPFLICCGPTDQAERLMIDCDRDVRVVLHKLPDRPDDDELLILRDWFRQRTGTEPPHNEGENVLLVQLVWEWYARHLTPGSKNWESASSGFADFSRRFFDNQIKPEPGNLQDFFRRTLALNRLYVGYPSNAREDLNLEQQVRLEGLVIQKHLYEGDEESRKGYWVNHPHLANLMYEACVPMDGQRRIDLEYAIKDCFRENSTPEEESLPLVALSNALTGGGGVDGISGRIPDEWALSVLPRIFKDCVKPRLGNQTLARLQVWIGLAATLPGLKLTPNPIEKAAEVLEAGGSDYTDFRETCHRLLGHFEKFTPTQSVKVVEAVIKLLSNCPDWPEWHHVTRITLLRTQDARLLELTIRWLDRSRGHAQWEALWLLIWNRADILRRQRLQDLAVDWLEKIRPGWITVWEILFPTELPLGQRSRIILAAVRWLDLTPASHKQWGIIWARIWKREPDFRKVLLASGARWLEVTRIYHGSWPHIWQALWDSTDVRQEQYPLVALGMNWLNTAKSHEDWGYVFRRLWESALDEQDRQKLISSGMGCLAHAPLDSLRWLETWKHLWKVTNPVSISNLIELGCVALKKNSIRGDKWVKIWGQLWRTERVDVKCRNQLIVIVAEKLPTYSAIRSLPTIQEHFWGLSQTSVHDVVAIVLDWFKGNSIDHQAWPGCWLLVWGAEATKNERSQFAELARDWLRRFLMVRVLQDAWTTIWRAFFQEAMPDEKKWLVGIANRWLNLLPEKNENWARAWKTLANDGEVSEMRPSLIRSGLNWAGMNSPSEGIWGGVWFVLWRIVEDEPTRKVLLAIDPELHQICSTFQSGKIIMGRVKSHSKLGLNVDIGLPAFMPNATLTNSQRQNKYDLVGSDIKCSMQKLDAYHRTIIVSAFSNPSDSGDDTEANRDSLLSVSSRTGFKELKSIHNSHTKHRDRLKWEAIAEKYPKGSQITGTVQRILKYGAMIEIEPGISGLLHRSDMSWLRKLSNPCEVVQQGESITCIVLELDPAEHRLGLGLKQMLKDPWNEDITLRFKPGQKALGKVTNLTNFGVFIELEPGLLGLVHASEVSTDMIKSLADVVKEGEVVDVWVLRVDQKERKIGLTMRNMDDAKVQRQAGEL